MRNVTETIGGFKVKAVGELQLSFGIEVIERKLKVLIHMKALVDLGLCQLKQHPARSIDDVRASSWKSDLAVLVSNSFGAGYASGWPVSTPVDGAGSLVAERSTTRANRVRHALRSAMWTN